MLNMALSMIVFLACAIGITLYLLRQWGYQKENTNNRTFVVLKEIVFKQFWISLQLTYISGELPSTEICIVVGPNNLKDEKKKYYFKFVIKLPKPKKINSPPTT